MNGQRIPSAGLVDHTRSLHFTFDGKAYTGHPGDTLASALLANGVHIMGRSFKYHRPRGPFGAWFDDPNAIFDVSLNGISFPNVPAATTPLVDSMQARAVNAWPSAGFDIKRGLDLFHRFLGAGFYYKTFMWPNWHFFEPIIRKMAGLGHLEGDTPQNFCADQRHDSCEALVVGGGATGLAAARAAAEAGNNIVLVEDHAELGGGLHAMGGTVDGQPARAWINAQIEAIKSAGGRILTATTAIGVYDHNMVALAQDRGFGQAPRLWRMRADRTIMATGAMDRPVTFDKNDLPGMMSLWAADEYLGRYGVLVGRKIVALSNNSLAEATIARLEAAGADIHLLDTTGAHFSGIGTRRLKALAYNGKNYHCDTLLVSGGLTPVVHLWRHAGGKLDWDASKAAFLPGKPPKSMLAAGAANGAFDLEQAIKQGKMAGNGQTPHAGGDSYRMTPLWPKPRDKGRQWIDFQHDVTLKDIEMAAQENFTSLEHLKRFTTLGMASDQGKTSNMAGLATMAALQGKSIPETGTTTFRPPFVPVSMSLYKGNRQGQQYHPLKRLVLETCHREAGAALGEYGGWLRPAWYGTGKSEKIIRDEVLMARNTAAIIDASPLGKIEVIGPDAEDFVNFIYYNTIRTLKPGHIRYGFMLTEAGIIFDDGVIARMDQNRFIISCSSSHVDGVGRLLENWRQDGHDPDRTFVHDTTANWATITISGPRARDIIGTLDLGLDLRPEAFAHMTMRETTFKDAPARVARVSFTGDASFEVSVPLSKAETLWQDLCAAGQPYGAGPIGIEALSVLRAEKGYIIIGKDTDGTTMPHDLGFSIPRLRKKTPFVGDRSLHTSAANALDRRQLVGLSLPPGAGILPTGAHLVTPGNKPRSIGIITSSYDSPTLGKPVALALLEGGAGRHGEKVSIWHLGHSLEAEICLPCFFDPQGDRLNA